MKAYEFLESHGWCRGTFAKTAAGEICGIFDPMATQFCASGAIYKVYNDLAAAQYAKVYGVLTDRAIHAFNDDPATTKADVVKLLRDADV